MYCHTITCGKKIQLLPERILGDIYFQSSTRHGSHDCLSGAFQIHMCQSSVVDSPSWNPLLASSVLRFPTGFSLLRSIFKIKLFHIYNHQDFFISALNRDNGESFLNG